MTHSRNHIHQRVEGQELYADDRDHNEWTNLAPIPNYSPLKSKLAKWLRKTCGQVISVDGGLHEAFCGKFLLQMNLATGALAG